MLPRGDGERGHPELRLPRSSISCCNRGGELACNCSVRRGQQNDQLPTGYPWGDVMFNTSPATKAALHAVRNTLALRRMAADAPRLVVTLILSEVPRKGARPVRCVRPYSPFMRAEKPSPSGRAPSGKVVVRKKPS